MAVMAGRVIPMFTNNGVPGAKATKQPWLEKAALGATLALLAADALQLQGGVLAALLGICAAAHLARWSLWQPWRTLRAPLVWVLHAAYLWIPVHLGLRAAAALGWLPLSTATHALTVGAIGGLIIGMMTRTARGHTGRPLVADRYEIACFAMVLARGRGARVRAAGGAGPRHRSRPVLGRAVVRRVRPLRRALLAGPHAAPPRRPAGLRQPTIGRLICHKDGAPRVRDNRPFR